MGIKDVLEKMWEYASADAAVWMIGFSTESPTSPHVLAPKSANPNLG
jgi:hypothetical protein